MTLVRRTPLKADPEKTRAWRRRSKRIKPRSTATKTVDDREERRDVVMAVLARDGFRCRAEQLWPDVECGGRLDVHEPERRRGKAHLDAGRCLTICRRHHDAIHENPIRSYNLGLLVRSG